VTGAADDVWRVAVVRSALGFQFCCGSCDRVSDPYGNADVTVALMVGHLFADHLPPPADWPRPWPPSSGPPDVTGPG
jgi:hypothetical protein